MRNWTWNAENRMTTVESEAAVPTQLRKRVDWTYLPDGRWIERIVSTNDGSAYYPSLTNRFVWDGKVLLAILDHTNGLIMSFVRGLDLSGQTGSALNGAGGVGGVLAVKVGSAVPSGPLRGSTHFVSYDGNGNVVGLADAATGESSAVYEYGPFGEVLRMTGDLAKTNPFRFSTKYQDDETDLLYYGYRYYNASTGRWLSRDPIGERGGINVYALVGNSPIHRFDPRGLFDGVTVPNSPASLLPRPEGRQLSIHIGFVEDPSTDVAAEYGYWTSDISILLEKEARLEEIQLELEKSLGPKDCIKKINISGHGGRSIGNHAGPEITFDAVLQRGTPERKLFDFLAKKMCKSDCCVNLKSCNVAKTEPGQAMMIEIARLLNADVTAFDDWYAIIGWGNEYTARPDGTLEHTEARPPYPFKDTAHGGKNDFKQYKVENIPPVPYPPLPQPSVRPIRS